MEAASTAAPAAVPQHIRALEHANRVRLARAALKRSVTRRRRGRRAGRPLVPMGGGDDVRLGAAAKSIALGSDEDAEVPVPLAVNENRQLGRLRYASGKRSPARSRRSRPSPLTARAGS